MPHNCLDVANTMSFLFLFVEFSQQVLVYRLYVSALSRNVCTYGTQVIEELTESILYHVRLSFCFVCMRVDNNVYTFADNVYVNMRRGHYWVPIVMDHTRSFPFHIKVFRRECLYLRIFVKRFVEHIYAYLRSI